MDIPFGRCDIAFGIKEKNLESEIETCSSRAVSARSSPRIKEKNLESEIETTAITGRAASGSKDQREESRVRD